jgi:hypothetical protein
LTSGQFPGKYEFRVVGPAMVGLICFLGFAFVPENLPLKIEYGIVMWATLGFFSLAGVIWTIASYFYLSRKEKQKYQEWVSSFEEGQASS